MALRWSNISSIIDGDGIGDTGWQLAGTTNSKVTYDTVVSPEVEGYKAEILSTENVPGLVRRKLAV